ncbi:MAG: hypothetical protein ABEK00_03180 [Candidatus Nanohaloarchaea archaeon]
MTTEHINMKENPSHSSSSPASGMTDQSNLELEHPNPIGLVQLKTLYNFKEVTI